METDTTAQSVTLYLTSKIIICQSGL
ncbi:hypothetical protein ABFA07_010646 [Porites harrisoni]